VEAPFKVRYRDTVGVDGRATIEILTDDLPPIVQRYLKDRIGHFTSQSKRSVLKTLRQLDESQKKRGKSLEELTKEDVQAFFENYTVNLASIRNVCGAIYRPPEKCKGVGTGFANFLASEEKIEPGELERIRLYIISKNKEETNRQRKNSVNNKRVALTEDYLRAIKIHADRMIRKMIDFILEFAARIYEGPCSVLIDDVDFEKKTMMLFIKPGGKEHILPFDEEGEQMIKGAAAFREIYAGYKILDSFRFLFCTRHGEHWTQANAEYAMSRIRESIKNCSDHKECVEMTAKAKLHLITWHTFRYTAARRAYDATKDIVYVRDLLGHESVEMTERYLGLDEEEKLRRLRDGLKKRRMC